jgi:hypothetical protein
MIAAWLHVSIRVSQSGRNEAIGVHSMRGETALRSRSSTWGLRGRPSNLLDKLGVTGSSPVPPTSTEAPLRRRFCL